MRADTRQTPRAAWQAFIAAIDATGEQLDAALLVRDALDALELEDTSDDEVDADTADLRARLYHALDAVSDDIASGPAPSPEPCPDLARAEARETLIIAVGMAFTAGFFFAAFVANGS